jgi:UDP-N-acetylmuramoyl-tripeptide--D-alanyl-D-alanine ligase
MNSLWTSTRSHGRRRRRLPRSTGVTFDSREVGPGDLFLALKGETTDGHRFLDQAFAQGAAGAIVSSRRRTRMCWSMTLPPRSMRSALPRGRG